MKKYFYYIFSFVIVISVTCTPVLAEKKGDANTPEVTESEKTKDQKVEEPQAAPKKPKRNVVKAQPLKALKDMAN